MQFRKSSRKEVKLKIGLSGTAGSGKTTGALLIAYGLCGSWDKIGLIDTENGSGELYTGETFGETTIGEYNYLRMYSFTPEDYVKAIESAEKAGIEVIIIDSITHEWDKVLEIHGALAGDSFRNWKIVNPRHNAFIQKILQCNAHVITTVRRKQDYEINKIDGRTSIQKVGLKEQTRDQLIFA